MRMPVETHGGAAPTDPPHVVRLDRGWLARIGPVSAPQMLAWLTIIVSIAVLSLAHDEPVAVVAALAAGTLGVIVLWRYAAAWLETRPDGLRHGGLWTAEHLAWNDVASIGLGRIHRTHSSRIEPVVEVTVANVDTGFRSERKRLMASKSVPERRIAAFLDAAIPMWMAARGAATGTAIDRDRGD